MNYSEIIENALAYSDRTDDDTRAKMPVFLKIVESRINKSLRIREQFSRAAILLSASKEYYGLPEGYATMRDIEIKTHVSATERLTPRYLSPEQMNDHVTSESKIPSYTIIANQIHVWPTYDEWIMEIVYAAKVPALDAVAETNWLSESSPSTYIFGLLVEIAAYAKDLEGAKVWDQRFTQDVNQLVVQDDASRWSGTSMQIRMEL